MQKSNRNTLLSCAVLVVTAACLCVLAALTATGSVALAGIRKQAMATPTATLVPLENLPEADNNSLPGDITRRMDTIQQQVINLRGFEPNAPLDRELLSSGQLRENVINDFFADYSPEEAEKDAAVLAALGLLEPGFDLIRFYRDLYSEQIAGYYDNETREMFVVQDGGFGGTQVSTYAHEYVHVLQDQVFDIADGLGYNDDACAADSEACLGVQALIEGDASVTEQAWLSQYATETDRQQIDEFYASFTSPVYDSAPLFMQSDFMFPYQFGAELIYSLLDRGGWEAVDAAYQAPPVSSEQVMHPEKYPSDEPVLIPPMELPALPVAEWQQIDNGVLGEWYLYLLLAKGYLPETNLADQVARAAASGWGGDAYAVYRSVENSSTVLVLNLRMDSPEDASELFAALQEYANGRWGIQAIPLAGMATWNNGQETAGLQVDGESVYLAVSPEGNLTRELLAQLAAGGVQ